MTLQEFLLRVLYAMEALVPVLITGLVATVLMLTLLYFVSRDAWLQDRRFPIAGVLFGISGVGRFHLACVWLKLVFVAYFLVAFQIMSTMHYWIVIVPGLLASILEQGIWKKLQGLFWLVIQLIGLFSANMICRFILQMSGGIIFVLIYIAIALFLALLSLYLFLTELLSLSDRRDVDPRSVWSQEPEEE